MDTIDMINDLKEFDKNFAKEEKEFNLKKDGTPNRKFYPNHVRKKKRKFILSEKAVRDVRCCNPIPNYYWEEDIKEFIRLLKEDILIKHKPGIREVIDKLAGDKLK